MKFQDLLDVVGDEPVFETGLLLAGGVQPGDVQRQLTRWVDAGRLHQLRRGLYAFAPPFQKVVAHPFLLANRLVRGSYVSLHSALAHYGLIPEHVPLTTSVTAGRPGVWDTPLGRYEFRHLRSGLLSGYRRTLVADRQEAFLATPEKALLDLIYLVPGAESPAYLQELRLQHLDRLDPAELRRQAEAARKPKLLRAAERIEHLAAVEAEEYETL